jgi:hypothetical protein
MPLPDKHFRAAVAKLEALIEGLHADADKLITQRVNEVAAEISGVPTDCLRNIVIDRASRGFCRCKAIKNMAAGDDGL